MQACQIIILCLVVVGFFHGLWTDFNGRKAKEPYGFTGAVVTVVVTALIALCYWKAGAFSTLFAP